MIQFQTKLLFKSGSYTITEKAYSVLEKVATVINSQPEMDVMIEGHTDATPIKNDIIQDNWDLSTKRATSITRILQYKFDIEGSRLIASGRGSTMPLVDNSSSDNRRKNRRTRIVILPNLDKFFALISEERIKE